MLRACLHLVPCANRSDGNLSGEDRTARVCQARKIDRPAANTRNTQPRLAANVPTGATPPPTADCWRDGWGCGRSSFRRALPPPHPGSPPGQTDAAPRRVQTPSRPNGSPSTCRPARSASVVRGCQAWGPPLRSLAQQSRQDANWVSQRLPVPRLAAPCRAAPPFPLAWHRSAANQAAASPLQAPAVPGSSLAKPPLPKPPSTVQPSPTVPAGNSARRQRSTATADRGLVRWSDRLSDRKSLSERPPVPGRVLQGTARAAPLAAAFPSDWRSRGDACCARAPFSPSAGPARSAAERLTREGRHSFPNRRSQGTPEEDPPPCRDSTLPRGLQRDPACGNSEALTSLRRAARGPREHALGARRLPGGPGDDW